MVAVAAINFGGDMPAPHQPKDIGEITPSKLCCLLRLLEMESQSSPTRWVWICNLVKHLKTDCGNIDLKIMRMLQQQADVLEDKVVVPQLAAA